MGLFIPVYISSVNGVTYTNVYACIMANQRYSSLFNIKKRASFYDPPGSFKDFPYVLESTVFIYGSKEARIAQAHVDKVEMSMLMSSDDIKGDLISKIYTQFKNLNPSAVEDV